MGTDGAAFTQFRSTSLPGVGTLTDTTTQIAFYNGGFIGTTGAASTGTAHTHVGAGLTAKGAADTTMRAYVLRTGVRSVPAADPTSVADAAGNLWVTGLIEVAL
jgi:hypothetical protein